MWCCFLASEGGRLLRRTPEIKASTDSVLSNRIVLLGKTGFGKSATGNTILGKDEFKSKFSAKSVTTKCILKEGIILDRKVSVIDTPGFFDTEIKAEDLMKEIAMSIYISSPGPHAFLFVFPLNCRFTDQEQQITELIELLFGEEVSKYAIILFTHGDQLEDEPLESSIDEIIRESSRLRHVVQQCGNRYHVFNNKEKNNKKQVSDLLQMIDRMIENNGGKYYSNEMYEDALKIKEQQKIKQREDEIKLREKQNDKFEKMLRDLEAKKSQIEEMKAKLEQEKRKQQKKEYVTESISMLQREPGFERFYSQYERRFAFGASILARAGSLTCVFLGGFAGGAIGLIGGPAGILAGTAVGAAVGVAVGSALFN